MITIVSSDTLPLRLGDTTTLSLSPAGSYQNISWSQNYAITSLNTPSTMVFPSIDTSYVVSLSDANNCKLSSSIKIPVLTPDVIEYVIPSAFSPNGDDVNDIFKVRFRNNKGTVLEMKIYNRWGELLYDLNTNDPKGWDGTYKGSAQAQELYSYLIIVKTYSGKVISTLGNLVLNR